MNRTKERLMQCFSILFLASYLIFITGCSDDCNLENPSVRLVNFGTAKADIQIKTSGGNTENINNIQPGSSSPARSFAPGEIDFTITIQSEEVPVAYHLNVFFCMDYTVSINPDNSVSATGEKKD
jgi:hypothetical protein